MVDGSALTAQPPELVGLTKDASMIPRPRLLIRNTKVQKGCVPNHKPLSTAHRNPKLVAPRNAQAVSRRSSRKALRRLPSRRPLVWLSVLREEQFNTSLASMRRMRHAQYTAVLRNTTMKVPQHVICYHQNDWNLFATERRAHRGGHAL